MTYRVTHHDNTRITLDLDGNAMYEMAYVGPANWALYSVHLGKRDSQLGVGASAQELIEGLTEGLVRGGHLAQVADGFVVPVPAEAQDFFVSGTGYLCSKLPSRKVLTERSVVPLGIKTREQIRPATDAERQAAGLAVHDSSMSALFLTPLPA